MPGAEWFPGARAELRRARLPRQGRRRAGDPARLRAARARPSDLGRAARRRPRGIAAGLRVLGVGRGDRVVGLHAEHPRDGRGVPRDARRWARRLVVRARPTSARARSSTASRRSSRRCCWPSTATATAARTSTAARRSRAARADRRRCEHVVLLGYLDARELRRHRGWRELIRQQEPLELRARPVRPPAVGALLVGDDRAAQGDRPRPGRHPARAPQEAAPAPRRAGRRPRLLVHDDRLDDVELPRRRAADRGVDRPLRRQPGDADARACSGTSPARPGSTTFGTSAAVHRRLHEGGRRARRAAATCRRCRPSARPARRCRPRASSGSTTSSAPTRGCSRPAAAPTCAPRSSAACRRCPSTWASCRRARWAPTSSPGTRTASR